jgi:hypothetical protein
LPVPDEPAAETEDDAPSALDPEWEPHALSSKEYTGTIHLEYFMGRRPFNRSKRREHIIIQRTAQ